ncbi:MAG: S-adenosylmethionine:tRNA ribosyltransferase-isomerase [Tannerellaceae bacterium]|jgi:S-adenosylmethionine:tRNA ribosyltransferase-isomerase|nr:S-adenosylmethionine:tRNA ribosyltransferase-isomerase [Tannerellaceae bacterium]
MTTKTQQIRIETYNYALPDERIAQYPLSPRDESRLLLYRAGQISESSFKRVADYLPQGSLLVFNNTRVIRARMLFRKESGARIEIFCLEPWEPADYTLAFGQTEHCRWTCLVGNLKKWKEGALHKTIHINGVQVRLKAERIPSAGTEQRIDFAWDNPSFTFAHLLEAAGRLPIPPYLHRETEAADLETYQTIYSSVKGSVASPTAGLHFTPAVLQALEAKGFGREELTLHVGAGTFRPVREATLEKHEMHTEYIAVRRSTIERIQKTAAGPVIAVGTTSVRTLESLYYVGVILSNRPEASPGELVVSQWMPYHEANNRLSTAEALQHVLDYLDRHGLEQLITATQILIAPGYVFRIVEGMITNFHQPRSTLLLLVSAFVQGDWERIYRYALEHDFRFLSYGDSSLLLPSTYVGCTIE